MSDVLRLADLPVDPDLDDLDVQGDPGCDWHPHPDESEVRDAAGQLRDLSDDEVVGHLAKPEAIEQIDTQASMSAEDSGCTPSGRV